MLLFVAFNQTYGAIMSFVGGTIVTTAVSSLFLGVAELVFAILIIVCCFTWFFCIGRFLGFMFFLSGRGVAYFLLGLLSLTDPRVATWLNIVQFLLCWCLIIFGIVRVRSVSSTPSHLFPCALRARTSVQPARRRQHLRLLRARPTRRTRPLLRAQRRPHSKPRFSFDPCDRRTLSVASSPE